MLRFVLKIDIVYVSTGIYQFTNTKTKGKHANCNKRGENQGKSSRNC